jgi:hypothetical protein
MMDWGQSERMCLINRLTMASMALPLARLPGFLMVVINAGTT